MRRDPWSDSCPDFPDLMPRFSRLKLSARLCNLDLNPDAEPSMVRLMCRQSRPFVQIFQTETLGAILQFWSKSGCGTTLGATLVQTLQTYVQSFQTETLGKTMQFGSESRCGVTLGATHV